MAISSFSKTPQRPRAAITPVNASTTSTSFSTVLNVNGVGRLVQSTIICALNTGNIKITVDGVSIFNVATGSGGTYYPIVSTSLYSTTPINSEISFKKSLLIEHKSNTAGSTVTTYAFYELE